MKTYIKKSFLCFLAALCAICVTVSLFSAQIVKAETGTDDPDSAGGTLVLYPEDISGNEEWASRKAAFESGAWSSNDVSGITIKTNVSATGILSFTPPGITGIIWSDDWDWFYTSDVADLRVGDVIAFPEDEDHGYLVNHIAVVVDVDHEEGLWYRTADGNYTTDTGVHITFRRDFIKRSSTAGWVCVWRHKYNGFDIGDSAWAYTRNIVWNNDTSMSDYYANIGMNWCNIYATELLLHTEKTTGFLRVTNNIKGETEPRDFLITLQDRDGEYVNETLDGFEFVDGEYCVTLNPGQNIKIENIPSGYYYTVTETSGTLPRVYRGYVRDAVDADIDYNYYSDIPNKSVPGFRQIYWAADKGIVQGYKDGTFKPENECTRANFVIMLHRLAEEPEPESNVSFSDIDESLSYYNAIQWAASKGIIKGFSDGTFRPDAPLTRAQILIMLYRYKESPEYETSVSFTDVRRSNGFYDAVQWGAEKNLIKGFDDGSFRPNDTCTRAQVMIIFFRADRNDVI